IRFDVTASGFHAMVTSVSKPTYYINPFDKASRSYIVNARNNNDPITSFQCDMDPVLLNTMGTTEDGKTTIKIDNANDAKLRQFRLALSVNGEYSQYFLDGSEADTAAMKAKVMDDLVACLVRANEVYERDFGIRMVFVDNEDTLIFIDPDTDPYSKSSSSWNGKIQKTCDSYIGNNNYDIGHLLAKASDNGNAGCIGCVCKSGSKGSGFTAYSHPDLLDYVVIDYWTHEMGHQYGANHTFTFSTEGTQAQVEPGSGSTIMGYAGITGSTDVQPHSDDLFSSLSISQNTSYIKSSAGGCAVVTETLNNPPSADAGADYIIPKSTPFVLTGTATDADASDVLSSSWEQIDVGTSSKTFPKATSVTGPTFRVFNYTASPTRTFPATQTILSGLLSSKWEALSSVARDLDFRYTVRDNHPGGGNNSSDDMVVTVDETSGPFAISVQNAPAETWHGDETKTITWDVANTDAAPVNCSSVNILLSTDGGLTFNNILASATANDGTEDITVPNVNTSDARIKIESVGNIFFDISNTDFTIESVLPVKWLSFTAQKINNAAVLLNWSTINESLNKSYQLERSSDAVNFATFATVSAGNNPAQAQQYTYTDYKAITGANYYRIKQVDADGKNSYSAIAKIIMPDATAWSVQPNPAKDATTFLARKTLNNINITLSNASGKAVYKLKRTTVAAGEQIIIPVNNLPEGMYILSVNSNENVQSQKIMVSK
ncbi:MAG TPA: M12 family metallo-peptidase, partial [Panacibacter sp.]|nr:M12 family metallo-peptidase [Panacibacter sp.]